MKFAARLMMVVLATPLVALPTPSVGQAQTPIVVVGILKNRHGTLVVDESVYFSGVTNGRGALEYSVKDGRTTGILNPQSKTDRQGRFRIEIRKDQLPARKTFTLGDWQGWFVHDNGELLVLEIPAPTAKSSKREVNVGTVIR